MLDLDLQTFLDQIDAAVVVFDANAAVSFVNRRGAELFSIDSDVARGQSTYDDWIVLDEHEAIIPLESRPIPQVLATGHPVSKQVIGIQRRGHNTVWGEISARPIFGEDGKIRCVIATFIDLSERMQSERALRESEDRFRAMFEGSAMGIALVDLTGRPVDCNPALLRMLGYTKTELLQMHFSAFTHPEDVTSDMKLYQELVEGKRDYYQIEKRYLKKDGSTLWGRLTVSLVLDADGRPHCGIGMVDDIHARKLAEEALRTSEARLLAINEASPMGIFVTNSSGDCIYRNRIYQELTGLSVEEAQGTGWTKALHPDDRERISTTWYQAVHDNRPYEATFRFKRRDTPTVWVHAKAARVGENTVSLGYVGVVEDITARKYAEEALRDERDLNAAILDTTEALIMVLDRKGCIVRFNARCEKVTGFRFAEVSESPYWETLVAPSDVAAVRKSFRQIVAGRFPAQQERPLVSRSGEQRVITWSYTAILDSEGAIRYVVATGLDVTDQRATEREVRESNERFKGFSEAAFEGIAVLRGDLIADANTRLCEMLGYTRNELTGRSIVSLAAHPGAAEALRTHEISGPTSRQVHQLQLVRQNGTTFPVEVRSRTIHHYGGPARVIAIRDITLRISAENQLKESLEQLRILSGHLQAVREEERTRVAREVHDELGQLLTAIKLELYGLRDDIAGALSDETRALLQKDLDSVRGLVDQTITSVRRIATDLRPAILDTLGLVPALEWQTRDFARRTGISATFWSDVRTLSLDPDKTSAVFRIAQESLTNVARHSRATTVKVRLQTSGNTLVLRVEDNGIGLPPAATSTAGAFGLIGMRERATQMGGSVTISSRGNKGTTVQLRVPIAHPETRPLSGPLLPVL